MVTWLFSFMFSVFLYFWTTEAVNMPLLLLKEYIAAVILINAATILVCKKDPRGKVRQGLLLIAVFLNIGMSVYCQTDSEYTFKGNATLWDVFRESYLFEIIMMFLAFSVAFVIVRYTSFYRTRTVAYLAMAATVICVYGAGMFGSSGGSNLKFFGVMVFAEVLLCYLFGGSWLCSISENRYLGGNPGMVSYNCVALLLWTFLLYFGSGILNNEFGLLAVLGLGTTILFFIKCRNAAAKLLYSAASAGGALLAATHVRHISDRVQIFLDPAAAYKNPVLKEQAESLLYLFRHWNEVGYWGNEPGHLSAAYYPTRTSDHLLVLLWDNFGVFFLLGVITGGLLLVRWMLTEPEGLSLYDKYLNLCCGVLTGIIMLLNVISCTTITIGVPFPFSSKGASINVFLLMPFVGIHAGLVYKAKGDEYSYDDLENEEF